MKIEGPRPVQTTSRAGKSSAAGEAGAFAKLLDTESTGEAHHTQGAASTNAVGGVFMLQGESDAERKKKRIAIARGQDVLSLLDQITYALLNHSVDTSHLARLKAMAGQSTENVADPRLSAVLEEIDLRLAVEAAKLEKASESAII